MSPGLPSSFTITAEDRGGGIGAVKLFQNGKLLAPEALVRQDNQQRNNVAVRVAVFRASAGRRR